MIQPEVLNLVNVLRTLQVTGFTKYSFELKGQYIQWATKYRQKWKGMEPNGARLIEGALVSTPTPFLSSVLTNIADLQALTIPDPQINPICTPTEFKFTTTDKRGRLALVESALPKTPIVLEAPKRDTSKERELPPIPATPKSVLRNPLALLRKKSHKRDDSYTMIMAEGLAGKSKGGVKEQPPTIEELQKIADDIRNGLY